MSNIMNAQQVIANVRKFHETFVKNNYLLSQVEFHFNYYHVHKGLDLDATYGKMLEWSTYNATLQAAIDAGYRYDDFSDYGLLVNGQPASLVVDTFSSALDAGTRATLIQQIESGAFSNTDFALGLSLAMEKDSTPSATQVSNSLNAFKNGEIDSGSNPDPITELSDVHLDFLTGVYVGSFLRAPEYEGFTYWASYLKELLNMGLGRDGAFNSIAATMQQAGAEHGEKGTGLSSSDYVSYLYQNVLGRAPDVEGHAYWVKGLESGDIGRSQFLATFLTAANEHASDAEFIASRTAVAKFAAQEYVSGPSAPGNNAAFLQSVLQGVTNPATAQAKINQLIDDYGAAPAQQQQQGFIMLSSQSDDVTLHDLSLNVPAVDDISVVGVASTGPGDSFGLL